VKHQHFGQRINLAILGSVMKSVGVCYVTVLTRAQDVKNTWKKAGKLFSFFAP